MNANIFLQSTIQQFEDYKSLADKTFAQLSIEDFFYAPNDASNSLATIITHMHGNMLSRWTNFLTEDGEKEWRNRDGEFERQNLPTVELLQLWDEGWNCLFEALKKLQPEDLNKIIYIRNKPLVVTEAIQRQLTHYASHVGQIIYIGKILKGNNWSSLSIAKGASADFNTKMKNNEL